MSENSSRGPKQLELWSYTVLIPKGTTIYIGQAGQQGGVFMGGLNSGSKQYFIPRPWTLTSKGAKVIAKHKFKHVDETLLI